MNMNTTWRLGLIITRSHPQSRGNRASTLLLFISCRFHLHRPREGAFFHFQLYPTVLAPCRPKTPAFHRGTHKQLRRHLESLQVKVLQPLSVWYCAPVHIIMQGMEVDMTCYMLAFPRRKSVQSYISSLETLVVMVTKLRPQPQTCHCMKKQRCCHVWPRMCTEQSVEMHFFALKCLHGRYGTFEARWQYMCALWLSRYWHNDNK